jgi:hypothetical protein
MTGVVSGPCGHLVKRIPPTRHVASTENLRASRPVPKTPWRSLFPPCSAHHACWSPDFAPSISVCTPSHDMSSQYRDTKSRWANKKSVVVAISRSLIEDDRREVQGRSVSSADNSLTTVRSPVIPHRTRERRGSTCTILEMVSLLDHGWTASIATCWVSADRFVSALRHSSLLVPRHVGCQRTAGGGSRDEGQRGDCRRRVSDTGGELPTPFTLLYKRWNSVEKVSLSLTLRDVRPALQA